MSDNQIMRRVLTSRMEKIAVGWSDQTMHPFDKARMSGKNPAPAMPSSDAVDFEKAYKDFENGPQGFSGATDEFKKMFSKLWNSGKAAVGVQTAPASEAAGSTLADYTYNANLTPPVAQDTARLLSVDGIVDNANTVAGLSQAVANPAAQAASAVTPVAGAATSSGVEAVNSTLDPIVSIGNGISGSAEGIGNAVSEGIGSVGNFVAESPELVAGGGLLGAHLLMRARRKAREAALRKHMMQKITAAKAGGALNLRRGAMLGSGAMLAAYLLKDRLLGGGQQSPQAGYPMIRQ